MKKKNWLVFILLYFLISGCGSANQDLVVTKIENQTLEQNAQEWIEQSKENGNYLYQADENTFYIYLNSYHVVQGDAAAYYEEVSAELADNKIVFSFSKRSTNDYDDPALESNRLLYKVTAHGEFDTIQLLENNEETNFKSIHAGMM